MVTFHRSFCGAPAGSQMATGWEEMGGKEVEARGHVPFRVLARKGQ